MPTERKPVSKRLRFEILKRDGFRCRYCGASPLNSILTVKELHADHSLPAAKGGKTIPENLVAACVDCNLGKSDVPLDEMRINRFSPEEEAERAEQLRAYMEVQREIAGAKQDAEAMVLGRWQQLIGDWPWSLPRYIPGAIRSVGIAAALEAVEAVARKGLENTDAVRYFCGCIRRQRDGGHSKPKPATEPARAYTESDIIEAKWEAVTWVYNAYWRHRRYGDEDFPMDLKALLREAIGSTKDKPAPLSMTDIFLLMDDAAIGSPLDVRGRVGGIIERVVELIKQCTKAGEVPDEIGNRDYIFEPREEHERERAAADGDAAFHWFTNHHADNPIAKADCAWIALSFTDASYEWSGVYAIQELEKIQDANPHIGPVEHVRVFREIIAANMVRYMYAGDGSPVYQWPEYRDAKARKGQ